MSYFKKFSENRPKPTSTRPVMDERGKKDLPPGTKGGEKMKPDLHEIHKQHTFDSFCKKVLKHEANNGHRDINHRALWEIPMSDLPEGAMEQLAVYDADTVMILGIAGGNGLEGNIRVVNLDGFGADIVSLGNGCEGVSLLPDVVACAPGTDAGRNVLLLFLHVGNLLYRFGDSPHDHFMLQ